MEQFQTKNKIYATCLACGFVPFKSLTLINPNASSIQHQVDRYVKKGELEKYHSKDVWTLFLTLDTKEKIMNAGENSPLYYGNALKQHYLDITMKDMYRLKGNKKVLDETDFEGLTKVEAREKTKKTNENARKMLSRKLRILRNGEAFIFFYGADFPSLPEEKPSLGEPDKNVFEGNSAFYAFRELTQQETKISRSEVNLVNNAVTNTKINGAFITPDANYSVIVTYKDIYQFSRESEINAKNYISDIFSRLTNKAIDGCVLLYQYDTPIKKMILRDSPKPRLYTENLFETYGEKNIFALPLSPEGQLIAKMMSKEFWKETLQDLTIKKEWQTTVNQFVTYDGLQNEPGKPITYHLNFLIPDLGRLKQFLIFAEVNADNKAKYVIHCYDIQADMLKECVKDNIIIHPIPIKAVYDRMK